MIREQNGIRYYTTGEVAKYIGCSDQTVKNYEKRGELKSFRTPFGYRLFHMDDVKEFVKKKNLSIVGSPEE